jgi:cold shock CspA family protein
VHTGTVTEFDDPRGIGVVTDSAGNAFPFHCTAIADGTRTIEAGAAVHFETRAGHRGLREAAAITPA